MQGCTCFSNEKCCKTGQSSTAGIPMFTLERHLSTYSPSNQMTSKKSRDKIDQSKSCKFSHVTHPTNYDRGFRFKTDACVREMV